MRNLWFKLSQVKFEFNISWFDKFVINNLNKILINF